MKKIISKNTNNKITFLFLILSVFLLLFGFININLKHKKSTTIKKAQEGNQCGNCSGFCSLNGQYCENFHRCEGNIPIFEIYICSNGQWTYAYSQQGGSCPNSCGSTPILTPTGSGCPCQGGVFNVVFRASRVLVQGEQITCTINGNDSNCACGHPCDGAYSSRSCGIGPGLSQCAVSGLDCTCRPFSYSCTGSGSASGTFTTVNNAGGETVDIPLSPPVTSTPYITWTPTPTKTPAPTKTPTPTSTLTPTETPTGTPPPTSTLTPTETPTGTPPPTSTPTNTPTPTEIVIANSPTLILTEAPTNTLVQQITYTPTPPTTGSPNWLMLIIPTIMIVLSLLL